VKQLTRMMAPLYWLPADVFEAEKQTSSVFQELPWHYLEVAHVLLTNAKECFPSVKEHIEVLLCSPLLATSSGCRGVCEPLHCNCCQLDSMYTACM
jgi:hypothetical protein